MFESKHGSLFYNASKLVGHDKVVLAPVDCSALLKYSGIEDVFSLRGFNHPSEFKQWIELTLGLDLRDWNATNEVIYQCWQPCFGDQYPRNSTSAEGASQRLYENDWCGVIWAGENVKNNLSKLKPIPFQAMVLRHKSYFEPEYAINATREPWLISRQRSYATAVAEAFYPQSKITPSIMDLVDEVGIGLCGEKDGVKHRNLIWPTGSGITLLDAAKCFSSKGYQNIQFFGDDLCVNYHSLSDVDIQRIGDATRQYGMAIFLSDLLVNAGLF